MRRKIVSAFAAVALLAAPAVVPAASTARVVCSILSDPFPGFPNGIAAGGTYVLTDVQGTPGGVQVVHETPSYRYRVVAGRTMIREGYERLLDFYVEIQNRRSGQNFRSPSRADATGQATARLEIVQYEADNLLPRRNLIFECVRTE